MKLYLLRHGHSLSVSDAKVASDFDRPLSEHGREAVRQSAQELLSKGARPALVLHSPLRRAVETAQEAAALLKPSAGVRSHPALANAIPGQELCRELEDLFSRYEEILAVGHQPQIGELAAFVSGALFELRPAGLIALEVPPQPPRQGRRGKPLWSRNPGTELIGY